ncbi:hybrid sensor histidine kinase/response regulator [Methyloterricola oryzae]|uniref:hybrid sensor histidine kinase/response regulator n=1 Tax=Methyloterricola oryzae TaxID=1495050 RepID=UPI0009E2FA5A|nr:ATP-binding protein [Methyloterricola oryzae]
MGSDKPPTPGSRTLRESDASSADAGAPGSRELETESSDQNLIECDARIEALMKEDQFRDEFLATLAHELRNFIAPQYNSIKVLRLSNGDTKIIERALAIMERQDRQMVRLLDDILDLSHIRRGSLKLQKTAIDLSKLVKEVLDANHCLIEEAGHTVSTQIPDEPVFVFGDPVRLEQVISNLISNAVKFTPRAGLIEVCLTPAEELAVFRVSDSGVGIPCEILDKVFDLYFQGDAPNALGRRGLGIGLNLTRRLVELHGGHIEANNHKTKAGMEFIVSLPIFDGHVVPSETCSESDDSDARHRTHRVLIADDNEDFVESLGLILELLGQEVCRTHGGLDALENCTSFHPDLILLNIGMPDLNGYETCRRMRAQISGEQAMIVAITGLARSTDKMKSKAAGFDRHLVKPVDPEEIKGLLESLA